MSEWFWWKDTNKNGKEYVNGEHPCGLSCYIQISGYDTRLTSTTFWKTSERKTSDKWLNGERMTSFEEAMKWIEARDPWHIYNNLCIPAHTRPRRR